MSAVPASSSRLAVVFGASSGLGREVARLLACQGWQVAVAARREQPLEELEKAEPGIVCHASIDACSPDAPKQLRQLVERLGGMTLYFHAAGIGSQNIGLEPGIETSTVATNCQGFTALVGEAYRYFAAHGGGHLCAITSIAATKGLGPAPAYSASKAFQATYLQALEQQSNNCGHNVTITDVRPGFVDTPLLDDGHSYPLMLNAEATARSIVKAINRRSHVRVVDWRWRAITAMWRRIPRALWRKMPLCR